MSRPEAQGPPEAYYDQVESKKYTLNSRIIMIQNEMTERAVELLALPDNGTPKLLLDLGCGSGLSGAVLSRHDHYWVGMDISRSMLDVAQQRLLESDEEEEEEENATTTADFMDSEAIVDKSKHKDESDTGDDDNADDDDYDSNEDSDDNEDDKDEDDPSKCVDLFLADMGEGSPFRAGIFDGCISISALQWLCHSNKSSENPKARLSRLFSTLFACLARGARAIFQFYPETSSQIDLILACAMKAGFTGGLVVDFPNSTRAKKYYLCLLSGQSMELPKALTMTGGDLGESDQHVGIDKRSRKRERKSSINHRAHNKAWVLKKKESARKRGEVKTDSKYTARKRRVQF